ncbi:MAG TPA: acyl carrier protein [Anaeromyxobacter sp.]|nr:acyl carrier protein [Anaeromyxobacter sp.]
MSAKDDIRQYIVENWLSGDGRGFADDTDLQENGILDSFTTLALVAFLEERYRIQLDPTDVNAENFRTVNDLERMVEAKTIPGNR